MPLSRHLGLLATSFRRREVLGAVLGAGQKSLVWLDAVSDLGPGLLRGCVVDDNIEHPPGNTL